MSKNMDYLRRELAGEPIRCSVDGVGVAVALTASELIAARAATFGSGGKLERYDLRALSKIRSLPNPHAGMFEAQFAGGRAARLMYYRDAAADVERLQHLLDEALPGAADTAPAAPLEEEEEEIVAVADAAPVAGATAAAVARSSDDERTARMNRILLALVVIPLVLLYVYSTYSR